MPQKRVDFGCPIQRGMLYCSSTGMVGANSSIRNEMSISRGTLRVVPVEGWSSLYGVTYIVLLNIIVLFTTAIAQQFPYTTRKPPSS